MDLINLAKEAAEKAGKTALTYFQKEHIFHHKGELANFATEADLACEKVIYDLVKKNYPDHNFLSEEMGIVDNSSEYTWVVDPIDGTVAFSHGWPLWGVSIALFKEKQPVMGVINLPLLQEMCFCKKGKGVFCNGKKIRVSGEDVLAKSLVATEFSYPNARPKQKFPFENFYRHFPAVIATTICTVLDFTYLACGKVEGLIEETPLIWDIAAGSILLEEAGGKITDWQGKPIVWELTTEKHYDIIASNRILHKEILERFNSYLKT